MAATFADEEARDRMVHALLADEGIEAITSAACTALGNPCFVSDSRFRVIATAQDGEVDDPLWNSVCAAGFLDPGTVLEFDRKGITRDVVRGKGTQEVIYEGSNYPWLGMAIGLDESHVAYFVTIESNRILVGDDRRGFEFAASVVACELKKARYQDDSFRSGIEHLLADLIEGAYTTQGQVEDAAIASRFSARPDYQLLVVRRRREAVSVRDIARFHIEQVLGTPYSVVVGSDLVFLMSHGHRNTLGSKRALQLDEVLERYDMQGGASSRFSNLLDLRRAYREALATVDLTMRLGVESHVVGFDDTRIYPFSGILAGRYDLDTFVHPSFRKLQEYDAENRSDDAPELCGREFLLLFFQCQHFIDVQYVH